MEKFQFDDDLVRSLAKLLEETGLTEIEFEAEGQRIRVGRNSGMVAPQSQAPFLASELENSGEESENT